ncbi:unnamed protein product [Urochloa humidicola]
MASHSLLILLATFSMLFVMASGRWRPSGWGGISCTKWGNLYANGSKYKENLDQLLATLPAAAVDNGWFYKGSTGSGADEVFGLIMCFADRNVTQCQECLADAAEGVKEFCPGVRNVTATYDACMLRYSAAPIPATADLNSLYAKYAYGEPITSQGQDNALLQLIAKLMAGVTASPLLVANVSAPYSSSQTMYGLAQCTRDLNASECTRCINHYVDHLGFLFPDQTGGAMKGYSCYLRYQVGAFEITLPPMPPHHHEPSLSSKTGLAIGLSIGAAFIVFLASLVWLHRLRQQKRARNLNEVWEQEMEEGDFLLDDPVMDDEFDRGTGPKQFRYSELATATDNFADYKKLGQGGFGSVYRGFLMEMSLHVAIKRVSRRSSQGRKEYASEVKIISRLGHRNLVQLIGWCHGGGEFLLVYELMPNGSLDKHLHSNTSNGTALLPWPRRLDIVLGLGSALLYLHQDCGQCVLHRDIKPSNVMLDASFIDKLGDFGLARRVDHGCRSHTTVPAGTMGYMDPECMNTGRASTESDIYSFGVVLLEIACGRRPPVAPHREKADDDDLRRQPVVARRGEDDREDHPIHIVQWVWEFYGRGDVVGAADARLKGEFDDGEMKTVMVVGLWCAHPHRSERPTIRQAVNVLRGEASLPSLPARMPVATNVSVTVGTDGTRTDSVYVTARKSD